MIRRSVSTIVAILFTVIAVPAESQTLRFSGFGDFVFGAATGESADKAASETFARFGSDPYPVNTNQGFGLTGTDFVVLADMTEAVTFLGEVNFQAARGGSSAIDPS